MRFGGTGHRFALSLSQGWFRRNSSNGRRGSFFLRCRTSMPAVRIEAIFKGSALSVSAALLRPAINARQTEVEDGKS